MSKLTERLPTLKEVKSLPNVKINSAILLGLTALGRIRKIDASRGHGPDMLDFFNHNGNVLSSLTAAMAASATVAWAERRKNKPDNFLRTKMVAGALATGAVVNALVETKTGLKVPLVECLSDNCQSVPDSIDFAYGMAGAASGGAMAVSMLPSVELSDNKNHL